MPRTSRITKSTVTDKADRGARYDFSQQVGHLLRRAYQRHLAIFQKHAADPQMTSVQFVTLCALRDHGPSTQAEIIRITHIDQATIRGIIERLERRGLVTLSADPEDGRKVVTNLTAEGQAALDRMLPAAMDITEITMADLNPAERVALAFLLRKVAGLGDG